MATYTTVVNDQFQPLTARTSNATHTDFSYYGQLAMANDIANKICPQGTQHPYFLKPTTLAGSAGHGVPKSFSAARRRYGGPV